MNLFRSKTRRPPRINSITRSPFGRSFLTQLVVSVTLFGLSELTHAQCPQICDANSNTALGNGALVSNTTGGGNTANGFEALNSNTVGSDNTAVGMQALMNAGTFSGGGLFNTAVGVQALYNDNTGSQNTAIGYQALWGNTSGFENTAIGNSALNANNGSQNTAIGFNTLPRNAGSNNTATGSEALLSNSTGSGNTATGFNALLSNITGSNNIALGINAGTNLTIGDNNIDIGNVGVARESGIIRIGVEGTQTATYIAGISGAALTQGAAVAVGVTADGQLGVRASSAKFKEAIKPMDQASEAILDLKPVTFRYRKELDPKGAPQFGLVAEDVAKVDPDLVVTDNQGKPFTVRYEEVNAMLLNEFLKEHSHVREQDAIIARQQKQIDALTATVQKMNTPLLQTIADNY